MSHSSNIPVSKQLDSVWGDARTKGDVRFIKIVIQGDQLVDTHVHKLTSSFDNDYKAIEQHLQPKLPCYVLFRLDSKNTTGFEWLLLMYIPDGSTVKDRMTYAATREVLRHQLGNSYIGDELHGSSVSDLTLESYIHYRESKKKGNADAPLTAAEIQASQERGAEIAQGVSKAYVHSVAFPVSKAAQDALAAFASGSVQLVQLALGAGGAETIELDSQAASAAVGALAGLLPTNEPRFMVYRFDHQHNNASATVNLFIYSCPGSSPVKQKMVYTTVKGSVSAQCETSGITLAKKLEIQEAAELTEAVILDELYGPKKEVVQTFDKPKAPGRGAPRLIRKDKP